MSLALLEPLAAYVLASMTAWSPVTAHPEGVDVAVARYREIARDIATLALDANEPPVFPQTEQEAAHEFGRVKTALLMASIASLESGFRADVDSGRERGGHGIAWCLMQVQVWGHTEEGWTGRDLVNDRSKCLAAGLHLIRASFTQCHALPVRDRLSAYTVGTCRAEAKAEWRTLRATLWFKRHPFEQKDSDPPPPAHPISGLEEG